MSIRILHPLFSLLASVTRQELARQVAYLKAENDVLRARLPKHIVTSTKERQRLLRAGHRLGPKLKDLISIVSYQTFCRWVREVEVKRSRTMDTSVTDPTDRPPGRPQTAEEIRGLVIRIRKETNYGYTKILQTLRRLGVTVSRQTVKNILVATGLEPPPGNNPDNWDSFLKRHAETLWQIDFCCKPMWTVRGIVDVYLLVCLHLGTRRMWIAPCTLNPDATWVAQQARNFLMHAEDVGYSPKLVIHDRDTKFTAQFDEILKSAGCDVKETAPLSPNLQAHVERAIQTLKHECLNAFVIVSQKHLNYIVREFQAWYNHERGHSARDHLPPACEQKPQPVKTLKPSDVACSTRLGGHLKAYSRRAA